MEHDQEQHLCIWTCVNAECRQCLPYGVFTSPITMFVLFNNLFYFDRSASASPPFYLQSGCTYSSGFPFTEWQQWNSNIYCRADGGFANDSQAFHTNPILSHRPTRASARPLRPNGRFTPSRPGRGAARMCKAW